MAANKHVAVILSGCGVFDGSEIYESVLTLLNLEKCGATYQCFAPNISQRKVINHLTQEPMDETRNVLVEAARLARGEIKDLKEAHAEDFDALIFPGGFGAALNLCNFAEAGEAMTVDSDVQRFATEMAQANKPCGYICIAPALIPKIYGKGVQLTIGSDAQTAGVLEMMGGTHINCDAKNIVIDKAHRLVTTPAYMLGQSLSEVAEGIGKLVKTVVSL